MHRMGPQSEVATNLQSQVNLTTICDDHTNHNHLCTRAALSIKSILTLSGRVCTSFTDRSAVVSGSSCNRLIPRINCCSNNQSWLAISLYCEPRIEGELKVSVAWLDVEHHRAVR
jgi:hypothetical protein